MQDYKSVAIVTLLALLLYVVMGLRVGRGRSRFGIEAPATSGHPDGALATVQSLVATDEDNQKREAKSFR